MSKKYTTNFLEDTNGSTGSANQVLISTPSGIDWVDGSGSGIIGGPYLPLSGGTMTGDLLMDGKAGVGNVIGLASGTLSDAMSLKLYTYNNIDPGGGLGTSTGNMIQADLGSNLVLRQTANDGDITFQSDDGSGGIATYFQLDGSHTQSIAWKDIHFVDGIKAKFGDYASPDLQIYHDGSDSYIDDTGTGWLRLRGNGGVILSSYSEGETMLQATRNGAVSLYYDNSKKFETSSTGVSVTGGGIFTGSIYSGSTIGNLTGGSLGQQLELGNSSITTLRFDADAWRVYAGGSGSSGEAFRVTETGNVGIGTTSPSHRLDVVGGSLKVSDTYATVKIIGTGGLSRVFLGDTADEDVGYLEYNHISNYFRIGVNAAERMRIDSSGNVGIGTTSPNNELEILGSNSPRISLRTSSETVGEALELGFQVGTGTNSSSNTVGLIKSVITQATPSALIGDMEFQTNSGDSASTKMIIKGDGNVGIGTTSPAQNFVVADTTNGNGVELVPGATATIQTYNRGTSTYTNLNIDTLETRVRSIGATVFNNGSGFSEAMRINASGNVGIGTTSPSYKLDVSGTGRFSSNAQVLTINGTDHAYYAWQVAGSRKAYAGFAGGGTTNFTVMNENTGNFVIGTNSSEKMRITGGGNVGIGTTSPGQKLTIDQGVGNVNQGIPATSGSTQNGILRLQPGGPYGESFDFGMNVSTTYAWIQPTNKGNHSVNYNLSLNPNGGNVGIGTTSPSYKLDVDGEGRFGDNGGILLTDDSGTSYVRALNNHLNLRTTRDADDIYFSTGTTTTTKMFIQGDTGNVGIGTTGPNAKLEVVGTGQFLSGSSGVQLYGTGGSGNINSLGTNDLIMMVNGNEKMRIRNSGNVGIGTTSPAVQLELGDNTADEKLRLTGAASGKPLMTFYNTTTKIGQISSSSVGMSFTSLGSGDMSFSNGTGVLVIENGGNVGIGTTGPSYKLDVDGVIRGEQYLRLKDTAGTNQFSIRAESTYGTLDNGSKTFNYIASNHLFLVGVSEKMRINSSGNVGIGTTSPSSKLHVKDTSLSGTLAYFEASSGAQGATNVRVDCLQYGTGIAFFRDGFVGGGACSFRNDSGTQVGSITIGTSSTAYNTSSDYRLKENLTLITDGIDRLKQLKPKRFNFIGETQTVDGFIAHEAKEVVPESVTGEKDAVLLNGNPIYQGIDQAKIVPLLTAALQEAVAKIEDLENRIQTLENK